LTWVGHPEMFGNLFQNCVGNPYSFDAAVDYCASCYRFTNHQKKRSWAL